MRALMRLGDPMRVMREWTWWQAYYALMAMMPDESAEPEATLNLDYLRGLGVIVEEH